MSALILKDFPIVYKSDLLLLNPNNEIAIACMWSLKQSIYDILSDDFKLFINLIGNTYSINSPNGIITNLCANRRIRHIIITGNILCYSDIVDRLIEVFASDKLSPYMNIYKDHLSTIRLQILTCQYIDDTNLNKYIECLLMKHPIYDLEFTQKTLDYFKNDIPALLDEFPINVSDTVMKIEPSEEYPSNISGYTVHCYDGDLYNTFLDICQIINVRGYVINNTKELNNLTVVLHKFNDDTLLQFPYINTNIINEYKTSIFEKNCPSNLSYTYGSLLYNFTDIIVTQLKENIHTRQCYIPLFESHHITYTQPPCIVGIHFRVVKGKLNLTVIFRSNDMFKAWILNVIAFSTYLDKICELTGISRGMLTTFGCSCHIYDADLVNLKCLLKGYIKKEIIPEPEGYYLINLMNKENDKLNDNTISAAGNTEVKIQVKLYSNDHELIKTWESTEYETLIHEVTSYINNPQHAAYVTKEIMKAHFTTIQSI